MKKWMLQVAKEVLLPVDLTRVFNGSFVERISGIAGSLKAPAGPRRVRRIPMRAVLHTAYVEVDFLPILLASAVSGLSAPINVPVRLTQPGGASLECIAGGDE